MTEFYEIDFSIKEKYMKGTFFIVCASFIINILVVFLYYLFVNTELAPSVPAHSLIISSIIMLLYYVTYLSNKKIFSLIGFLLFIGNALIYTNYLLIPVLFICQLKFLDIVFLNKVTKFFLFKHKCYMVLSFILSIGFTLFFVYCLFDFVIPIYNNPIKDLCFALFIFPIYSILVFFKALSIPQLWILLLTIIINFINAGYFVLCCDNNFGQVEDTVVDNGYFIEDKEDI